MHHPSALFGSYTITVVIYVNVLSKCFEKSVKLLCKGDYAHDSRDTVSVSLVEHIANFWSD